jgi:hypothetical protein
MLSDDTKSKTMKVKQLIELLEQYDENLEVRFATQPSWPFECSIKAVTSAYETVYNEEDEEPNGDDYVILVEGSQLCYGRKEYWEMD